MKNRSVNNLVLFTVGSISIALVVAFTYFVYKTTSHEQPDSVKFIWNKKFPNNNAYHVSSIRHMRVYEIHAKNGIYFSNDSVTDVIKGQRFAFYDGALEPITGRFEADKPENLSEIPVEKIKESNSNDVNIAIIEDKAAPKAIDETRELVKQLKDELAKSMKIPPSIDVDNPALRTESKANTNVIEKVQTDRIREDKSFVFYNNSKLNKVQYDKFGQILDDKARRESIKSIFDNVMDKADSWTIAYKSNNEKSRIIVFSDPTCPYCQKLHRDVSRLNDAGISVYYLLYPRALASGSESESSKAVLSMMNAYWCSETPQVTMDKVYNYEKIPESNYCFANDQGRTDFPVQEHYLLGRIFNLAATPLTILEDGRILYGYGGFSSFTERLGEI